MEKTILKIGQVITIKEDLETKGILGDSVEVVKKGDKAIVKANGWIEYITGESCGKMQRLGDQFEAKGYDTESIAERLMNILKNGTYIGDYIDTQDEYDEIREEIEYVLDLIFI